MRGVVFAVVLTVLTPIATRAAGLASGPNFSVITPAIPTQEEGDTYATLVLHRAEAYRSEFAQEWLGEELAVGDGRAVISVRFSTTENSGMTLAKDHPSQKFHNVFLASTSDNAASSLLRHEIAHVVLATAFPHRLPPWVEEGIASRYDAARLIDVRQQEVRAWVRTRRFPALAQLLDVSDIPSFDDTGYAAAESLVTYLLTRGDKRTLLRFADEGRRTGWDVALRTNYDIAGLGELERDWRTWLTNLVR